MPYEQIPGSEPKGDSSETERVALELSRDQLLSRGFPKEILDEIAEARANREAYRAKIRESFPEATNEEIDASLRVSELGPDKPISIDHSDEETQTIRITLMDKIRETAQAAHYWTPEQAARIVNVPYRKQSAGPNTPWVTEGPLPPSTRKVLAERAALARNSLIQYRHLLHENRKVLHTLTGPDFEFLTPVALRNVAGDLEDRWLIEWVNEKEKEVLFSQDEKEATRMRIMPVEQFLKGQLQIFQDELESFREKVKRGTSSRDYREKLRLKVKNITVQLQALKTGRGKSNGALE